MGEVTKIDKNKEEVIVEAEAKPRKGIMLTIIDLIEKLVVKLMHDSSQPHRYLSGNFAPVSDETPPVGDLPISGYLPECLNGEFVRVGPNPKFAPVAGCHWFDGDGRIRVLMRKSQDKLAKGKFGRDIEYICDEMHFHCSMIHGVRIKDGRATYVSRYVNKQEVFFGGAKFMKLPSFDRLVFLLSHEYSVNMRF